jgi:LysR family glycine cleavage system transcriptional activator
MRKLLPSTMSLRAFEATARHLSFTRAAAELNLTQTAISHQIRNLEKLLGIRLFMRERNTIRLSQEGRDYLENIRPALAQISAATDGMLHHNLENVLTVGCLHAFAVKCLLPRLGGFRQRHPEIVLRLNAAISFDTLRHQDYDVAIWHGSGDWPGLDVQRIGEEEIFPVCSPLLLAGRRRLKTPADLRHHTVIRTASPLTPDDWPAWLEHAGVPDAVLGPEIHTNLLLLSVEAAVNGLGVFMGRTDIVRDDLAAGRLAAPFAARMPSNSAYHAVVPIDKARLAKVRAFKAWLAQQFG